jgi:hypothetical protein
MCGQSNENVREILAAFYSYFTKCRNSFMLFNLKYGKYK